MTPASSRQAPPTTSSRRVRMVAAGSRWWPDDVLVATFLGALVLAIWPAIRPAFGVLSGQPEVNPIVLLAHVCGMLAGYGVVILLLLMSRTPALENGVGADRLTRW